MPIYEAIAILLQDGWLHAERDDSTTFRIREFSRSTIFRMCEIGREGLQHFGEKRTAFLAYRWWTSVYAHISEQVDGNELARHYNP